MTRMTCSIDCVLSVGFSGSNRYPLERSFSDDSNDGFRFPVGNLEVEINEEEYDKESDSNWY